MGPPDVCLDRIMALAGRSTKTAIPPRATWVEVPRSASRKR